MRQSHEPFRSSDAFCPHQFLADCTINMFGFNFRQDSEMSATADKAQSVTERLLNISTAGVWPQFASLAR